MDEYEIVFQVEPNLDYTITSINRALIFVLLFTKFEVFSKEQ